MTSTPSPSPTPTEPAVDTTGMPSVDDPGATTPEGRLVAFVGSYASGGAVGGGGVYTLDVSSDGRRLVIVRRTEEPAEAGFLAYSPDLQSLYVVDERKSDGRGPVGPPASVQSFRVDQRTGALTRTAVIAAPGPFPTYLDLDPRRRLVFSANHGSFDHVERVTRHGDSWSVEYLYDDSAVIAFDLDDGGALDRIRDVHVLSGHGPDPNTSPQAGGHAQASPHAHCAVLDPASGLLLVADKATDKILVLAIADRFELVGEYAFEPQTGPRHIAVDPVHGRVLVTCEFSSELAALDLDRSTGVLTLTSRASTVSGTFAALNEPADLRLHPNGRVVYVNNRGEDSLAWLSIDDAGQLRLEGRVRLSRSVHPGLAARSFALAPGAEFLIVADRPANLLRSYAIDDDGSLRQLATTSVPDPAYVEFAILDPASS